MKSFYKPITKHSDLPALRELLIRTHMFDLIEKTHKFLYPKYRLQVMDGDMVLSIAPQVSVASTLSMDDEERLERNDSEFKKNIVRTANN